MGGKSTGIPADAASELALIFETALHRAIETSVRSANLRFGLAHRRISIDTHQQNSIATNLKTRLANDALECALGWLKSLPEEECARITAALAEAGKAPASGVASKPVVAASLATSNTGSVKAEPGVAVATTSATAADAAAKGAAKPVVSPEVAHKALLKAKTERAPAKRGFFGRS